MSLTNEIPLVSWLLCTNREDELLHRAIRSCLNQSIHNFELIIIVNGADAKKIELSLREFYSFDKRVRVEMTPVHMLNFSLNYGLHLARANYVARMDADDVSSFDRLREQLTHMEDNPTLVVLGTSYSLIDENNILHGEINLPETNEQIRRNLFYCNPICHPSVMFRRQEVSSVGGYLGGQNSEDYDLWIRLALNPQFKFLNLPRPLLKYNLSMSGQARRSRAAYANIGGVQLRNFLMTYEIKWLVGALISCFKATFFSKKN